MQGRTWLFRNSSSDSSWAGVSKGWIQGFAANPVLGAGLAKKKKKLPAKSSGIQEGRKQNSNQVRLERCLGSRNALAGEQVGQSALKLGWKLEQVYRNPERFLSCKCDAWNCLDGTWSHEKPGSLLSLDPLGEGFVSLIPIFPAFLYRK